VNGLVACSWGVTALLRSPGVNLAHELSLRFAPRLGRRGQPRRGEVDSGDGIGMRTGEASGDAGTEIASVGDIPFVPEAVDHDLVPHIRDGTRG
jgi:hypothetical protein